MPSPFHGIELAGRALRSYQRALAVTGHNIANVNTRGYSRQSIDFVPTDPAVMYLQGRHFLGTGVTIGTIGRIRDAFLDERARTSVADQQRFDTMAHRLAAIEGVAAEPGDEGIGRALDRFFDAWSAFGSNPNQVANRMQVRLAGQTLTSRMRRAHADLGTVEGQLQTEAQAALDRINQLAQRIHALNGQIREATATGSQPADLLDQRDLALEDLSGLATTSVARQPDNTVTVSIGKFLLVGGAGSFPIPRTLDAANQAITDGAVQIPIRSGKLAGLLQATQRVTTEQGRLDTLANQMRTLFNTLHQTGTNANATTNVRFFNDAAPQTGAIDFDLSGEVLADDKNISSGVSGNAGDGGLALSLANLRTQPVPGLGDRTFGDYYRDGATKLGADTAYFLHALSTSNAILQQIEAQRQAVSGVSLDEEMAAMLRFQRSYQAAAKALTVFDQMTEDLIGMLRR